MMYRIALIVLITAVSGLTVVGQAPLPLRGQQPDQQGGRGRGRGQGPEVKLPATPTVAPLAMISPEVTGPGEMFSSLMPLPSGDDMAYFDYQAKEYYVSGTAQGQPYRTRIVVRRPRENSRFSGVVLAESMHPSGNAWMFHFTHRYSMSSGHIGLEIVTSPPAQFVEFNGARYKDMKIEPGQAAEIIAQVGALIRSKQAGNPLADVTVRKMVLAGTSASAGVLINYLPAHMVLRLQGMRPIYDGFLPTSNGADIRKIDVPLIQIPTTTEAHRGNLPTRLDSDLPGDQYRAYEFAGMAHLDTRDVPAFRPNPCKFPISMFPLSAYMSVGLHHLVQWIDKGTVPPRAPRFVMDNDAKNDGSLMALDEHGNPRGGIRSPYVDVPAAKYGFPNEGASPPTPNTVPWVALRGEAGINQLCGLTGYEIAFSPDQFYKTHKSKAEYLRKFRQRLDALTKLGWSLPVYHQQALADAAKVGY
jgi:hypothetical protein